MRIVAIGAHLDDIELACGGTILKAVDHGHEVFMVVTSGGGSIGYDDTVIRTEDEALKEGEAAAKILGVKELVRLDFPDKNVPYNSNLVEDIDKYTKDIKPDYIFSHWPFDTHQDHKNTALASISACRYFNTILMFEPITPSGRSYIGFRPQAYVDMTPYIDKKLESLKSHQSQYRKYGERWLEAVKARANHRGFEMGVNYAEAFEVMRLEVQF